jgi:GxxExxY protein
MDLSDQIETRLEHTDPQAFEGASSRGILYPELSWEIVAAAIEVHKHIGPGQLESVYQRSMECELRRRAIAFRAQVPVPMFFKGERVGDFFADLIVEDTVILELEAVERWKGVHTAQLLTYLHAAHLRLGILMNFNVTRMVHGVKRVVR